ncbi:MAG: DUF1501 domain-containing protein [Planctomycetota bacterium]|nr:DUF1501 domain-containing protein [Planctomycetota bacterium]MDA1211434.1 DUF1501 domain-containing protein [Planctomycetota bacterium]
MTHYSFLPSPIARRSFLWNSGVSLGSMALASLGGKPASNAAPPSKGLSAPRGMLSPLHHSPRAKRIIWLYMAGGMSHLETFDDKPSLRKRDGEPMPESITAGQQIAQLQGQQLKVLAPQHRFLPWGSSGLRISEIWPMLGEYCADEMCMVHSLFTEAINHDPAHTFMNTGTMNAGRPAAGSWLWYGLGSDADNLPGFVVMVSTGKWGQKQPIAARQWHSGFLPSKYQGVEFRGTGDPVLYLSNPSGVSAKQQRDVVDAVQKLNQIEDNIVADPEIATRISQYELAFKMQTAIPELKDFADEPEHILNLYGTTGGDGSFASNCLLARRLAERGVRFIQLYHRDWDHHGAVKEHSAGTAAEVDRGVAALIVDLKQRGLLDDTIIVFGSEFGRTPMAQGNGRDHHLAGFTMWFAGGGFKGGTSYGATDEFGYRAVENRTSVHDVHATLLHLMGIDHHRFSVKSQGLDSRLTGVEPARVVNEILA